MSPTMSWFIAAASGASAPLPRAEPAVDDDILPRHIARGIGSQEHGGADEVVGFGHASHRYAGGITAGGFIVLAAGDPARRQGVDAHATRRPVRGEVAGQADDARLRGAIDRRRVDAAAV